MHILVTGGAGYIGSHVVKLLLENSDHQITIVDNLVTGFQKTIDTLIAIAKENGANLNFLKEDLSDFKKIEKIMYENQFDAIIHFAASLVVPESIENPLKYYLNNTANTTNLIKCATENGVKRFIFSSTLRGTSALLGNGVGFAGIVASKMSFVCMAPCFNLVIS